MHCQIICSTHSSTILEALPPEARFFIEGKNRITEIIPQISAKYACGKLSAKQSSELTLFVEDEIGEAILSVILPLSLRERCRTISIGSSEAVLRQLAARYRENESSCIAFLDGDKRGEHKNSVVKVKNYLEGRYDCTSEEMDDWIDSRLKYLPGETWPEIWLVNQAVSDDNLLELEMYWGCDCGTAKTYLEQAARAGKHHEFSLLKQQLHQDRERLISDIIRFVKQHNEGVFETILENIKVFLDN